MLLTLALPSALDLGGEARVRLLHVAAGGPIATGTKILDFAVDLSAGAAHDCPPISHYRLIARETGWLRALSATVGDTIAPGQQLGLLATEADEPAGAAPARAARVTVASIVFHAEGWGGRA